MSEFLCLLGAFDWREGLLGPHYAVPAAAGMVLGAIYILYMVGRVVFGPVKVPGHEAIMMPMAMPRIMLLITRL
ncbi:MAG: hypothetical protein HC898_08480 [Phycisphaerales bacterium]|nr:hypothetical protein [Phycisphaerales bacterium]